MGVKLIWLNISIRKSRASLQLSLGPASVNNSLTRNHRIQICPSSITSMSIVHEIGTTLCAIRNGHRASRDDIGKTIDHRYRIGYTARSSPCSKRRSAAAKSDVGITVRRTYGSFFNSNHVMERRTERKIPCSIHYVRASFASRLPCRPSWRTVCDSASHVNERSNLSLSQMILLGIP